MSEKSLKPIIHSIFPTPIYTTKMDRGFTKQELQFVDNQKNKCTENKGNINTRISLSFNTFYKGTVGSNKDLTELIL